MKNLVFSITGTFQLGILTYIITEIDDIFYMQEYSPLFAINNMTQKTSKLNQQRHGNTN